MSDRLVRLTAKKDKAVAEWEDQIRAEMAREGATLREVAARAGISYEQVRRIQKRKR